MANTYAEKLKDPRWQKKRLEVMQSAGFRCEDCGDPGVQLHVHHCAYLPRVAPHEHGMDLLMCLCERCHAIRQSHEDAARIGLGRILRTKGPNEVKNAAWVILEIAADSVTLFGQNNA